MGGLSGRTGSLSLRDTLSIAAGPGGGDNVTVAYAGDHVIAHTGDQVIASRQAHR